MNIVQKYKVAYNGSLLFQMVYLLGQRIVDELLKPVPYCVVDMKNYVTYFK